VYILYLNMMYKIPISSIKLQDNIIFVSYQIIQICSMSMELYICIHNSTQVYSDTR